MRSVGCCSLFMSYAGDAWAATSSAWSISGSTVDVSGAEWATQALCGLTQPPCRLYRRSMRYCILHGDVTGAVRAVTGDMWDVVVPIWDTTHIIVFCCRHNMRVASSM